MKPVRYVTYLVSTSLVIVGIYLMTDGEKIGGIVMILGACCSNIGRPPSKPRNRPFLPANRLEWILGLALIAVPLFAFHFWNAVPPPNPVPEPHPPLSPVAASVAALIFVLLIGAKFLREKRDSESGPRD